MDKYKIIAAALFIGCCALGSGVAGRAALQNDEIYSQQRGVQQLSYAQILQGQILEGNNAPLFYITQKIFLGAARFRLNDAWPGDEMDMCNAAGQQLMRALPVACMSLAITSLFYFFARRHGMGLGLAAAGLMLTSPMVWMFWAQARPYALWICLTTAQLLTFLHILKHPDERRPWRFLAIWHILLSLTTPFGLIQACAIAVVLRRHFLRLTVLPAAIAVYYVLHAPHFQFRVPRPAIELFTANFPLEYGIIIAVGAGALWALRALEHRLLLAATSLCGASLLIIGYYVNLNTQGTAGFGLSPRYFIFLVPVGVVTIIHLAGRLWAMKTHNKWMRLWVAEALAGVLMLGALRTYVALQGILL